MTLLGTVSALKLRRRRCDPWVLPWGLRTSLVEALDVTAAISRPDLGVPSAIASASRSQSWGRSTPFLRVFVGADGLQMETEHAWGALSAGARICR